MIAFEISYTVDYSCSMNALKNGFATSKIKKSIEEAVGWAMWAAGIKKLFIKKPVEIHIFYDSQLDLDNHGLVTKAIIDAMKERIFIDDNKKHVVRLVTEFWNGNKIRVEIIELDPKISPYPSPKKAGRQPRTGKTLKTKGKYINYVK